MHSRTDQLVRRIVWHNYGLLNLKELFWNFKGFDVLSERYLIVLFYILTG